MIHPFSIHLPTRNLVLQMTNLESYSVFFKHILLSKDDIYRLNSKEPVQDISDEGTNVRSLLIGLATTAFAGLCFTSGNTLVKLLPPGSSYDILLLRSLIQVQHVVITNPYKCCFSKYVNFFKLFSFAYSSNCFSKMQLMLPLVIRADNGFYGAEDWATRLAKKDICHEKLTFIPSSGGGLLVRVPLGVSFS